jgi:hypothetical protein
VLMRARDEILTTEQNSTWVKKLIMKGEK